MTSHPTQSGRLLPIQCSHGQSNHMASCVCHPFTRLCIPSTNIHLAHNRTSLNTQWTNALWSRSSRSSHLKPRVIGCPNISYDMPFQNRACLLWKKPPVSSFPSLCHGLPSRASDTHLRIRHSWAHISLLLFTRCMTLKKWFHVMQLCFKWRKMHFPALFEE